MSAGAAGYHSHGPTCPRCSAAVFRVSRRLIDVLISIFVPVRRFRCRSMNCGWEGNFRDKRLYLLSPAQGQCNGDNKYHLLESSRMGGGVPPVKPAK